jgi:hypothetical protein
MATTMTYDAGTDTVSTSENLTPDEQDSLQVGEALEEQQEQMLAGKYKNAKELENAYIELTKKLGEKSSEDSTEESSEPEAKEDTPKDTKDESETSFLDQIWEEANSEYKPETLEKLRGMSPTDLANEYIDYRKNAESRAPAKQDLTDNDVAQLHNVVGGKENYNNMLEWAQTNLQEQEIAMFDTVMDRGDPLSAFFAVRSLAYRYNDAVGYDGKMLTGTAAKGNTDVYRSQAEVVKAMSDPKYDNDPAYRRDVMNKLERSKDLEF